MDGDTKIDEVFSDDGTGRYLNCGSVAARYGNLLLMGTVNNKATLCQLQSLSTWLPNENIFP